MPHLSEEKLIGYRFELLEAGEAEAVRQHLEECEDCRGQLEELGRRLASLDLLQGEVEPSEALIRAAVEGVKSSAGRRLWKRPPFYFSAAAVLMAAGLLYVLVGRENPIRPGAGGPVEQTAPANRPMAFAPRAMGESTSTDAMTARVETPALAMKAASGVRAVAAEQIPDKPPFAPASAIELVVLPRPETTQLTIYNSADLTLVRDTRRLTLKPGWNWLQFMWAGTRIDPTSLSIRPLGHADRIEIEQLVYPARLKDIGRWLIRSEVEGAVEFEITYFASGLNWRAFYMGTMDEREETMDLTGYVRIQNGSGQDFENAQTRLVLGQVHLLDQIAELARRRYPYGPDILDEGVIRYNYYNRVENVPILGDVPEIEGFGGGSGMIFDALEQKKIEKQGLSEYYLYTIEGTETIADQWGKRLPSLDVEDIPVKSLYKYDEDRYGDGAVRFVSFANDTEHKLGTTPLPEGTIRIYRQVNERQNLSYVGGTELKYIPVNEEVELNLGPARLVKIEPVLMDTRTEHFTFDPKGNIDGWDEVQTWRLKLTNTRELPVDVEITRSFNTQSWDLTMDDPTGRVTYTKHDVTRARFTATIAPRSEQAFEYTVTKYQGRREEMKAKETSE